ncbi:RDD family protein [Pedobacter yonginense]|uniref:RDD family protein n=1 Tax=Pedobacter yonginense TaxID=651869 RepID=A0A317EKP9_9SPHI|nr:RDD family protein [Pedobacter yonginense]PWS27411.1 RDD family protein [Pedobacter yonginense]
MEQKYPNLLQRLQSTFIDTLLIILLMVIFSNLLDRFENVPDWIRIALFISIFFAYEPLLLTFGCTLGNYVKGIRVRKYSNPTEKINIFQALVRYPFKAVLGWVSFLTIHTNEERRAIHDLVSGSVMIKL